MFQLELFQLKIIVPTRLKVFVVVVVIVVVGIVVDDGGGSILCGGQKALICNQQTNRQFS